ncbi:flagellin [Phreatobacter oligotrophus]|uniref:Flagellin n=1 Tax=Phreatobacter oligotrophus TaxID=1122261 RepID=A0A2T4ZHW9_9HYPH|nr:flagellin [Phreatobacter oligotrophus]PTM61587.1 flagellin [Phreatobacter oligotrophus]
MPVISTNIAANSAVRYLNVNSADQTSSLSKLASGSRISQASDDAAGLAISTRITSDVTTLTQAATNASHGISVLQTADGGAANISDILQRMKALASQSASGTVTDNERTYIDAEFSQLTEEINGISESTRYNGQSLLDGSSAFANGVSVMVGSDASDTITVSIAKLTAEALGITAAEDEAAADLVGGTTGFDASAGDVSFKVNGTTVTLADDGGTNSDGIYSADDIADAINAALGSTSTVTASVDSTTGALTLSNSATGSSSSISLTDFTGLSASDLGFDTTSSVGRDKGDTLSVAKQDGASAALEALDKAINTVSKARADIGATESRFAFRSESIATSIENLSAANSAIEDVDVASESAKLASAKVKTQAAVAAASQASQMPQDLLKLLQ